MESGRSLACIVYGLRAVGTEEIRYIGQTRRKLRVRYLDHLNCARKPRSAVQRWIARAGDIEAVVLIEQAIWNSSEVAAIEQYRTLGHRLTNASAGGSGNRSPSPESVERRRQKHLGSKRTTQQREHLSAVHRARLADPAVREATAERTRVAFQRPEVQAAHRAACQAAMARPETKKMVGAASKATWQQGAYAAKQSEIKSRLTVDQVLGIRRDRAAGASLAEICRRYSICKASASQIANGRTFKHLL